MNFSGHVYPDGTIGYFRVASATGRQPIEPVASGEFRIGSGPSCQLRLGDSSIADVHTVLRVHTDHIDVECLAPQPLLLLNGEPVTSASLEDGDLVEIGHHRLLFRRLGTAQRITLDESAFGITEDTTAEDLVDQLAHQIDLIQDMETPVNGRVSELLQAAESVEQRQPLSPPVTNHQERSDMQTVAALLQQHHEASRVRLESLTNVLNHVVKQQKLIADTLEVLSERVQALDAAVSYQQRKSA